MCLSVRPSQLWILLIFIMLILILQIMCIAPSGLSDDVRKSRSSDRQIGKSDLTIYTVNVTSAGLEVPDEYVNEVAMIKFSDDEPIEGDNVIINATVFNVGTRGATATVYFYDGPLEDNDLIGKDNLTIHPLGYSIASTPWDTTGEDEFHTIYVFITTDDPENETSDENNQATRDIVVNQIPFAIAGSDQDVLEDDVVYFDGSGSTDTESDLLAGLLYTWDFNDPLANSSNPNMVSGINLTSPTHFFTKQGVYEVNLTVTDDGGAKAWDIILISVTNIRPGAVLKSSAYKVNEDEEITFYFGDSWDTPSDKNKLLYHLDLDDGRNTGWINGTEITDSYANKGEYTVKLQVRDDNNETDSTTWDLRVKNVAPRADAGDDQQVFEDTVWFDASGSWDTKSDLDKLDYSWDFHDGSKGNGMIVSHKYSEKGTYAVALMVTDDDGCTDHDAINVYFNNLQPIAKIQIEKTSGEIQWVEDEELMFNGTGSYDPDGMITSFSWDFGDGATGVGDIISHTYPSTGFYEVTLTVGDDYGVFAQEKKDIVINNLPPEADAGSDLEVYEGEDVIFDGRNSSDTPSDMPDLKYIWDFGDNSTSEGIITNHTYLKKGEYNVTLKVMDDDGEFSISKIRVFVRNILLSSIDITETIEPNICEPGDNVTVSGEVAFEFVKTPTKIKMDFTLARVVIKILETGDVWTVIPDIRGNYNADITAPEQEGTYSVRVSITRLGIFAEEIRTLSVQPVEDGEKKQGMYIDLNTSILLLSVGITAGGLGAFTAGTDLGRYSYFTLLIPLYTRLHREAVLDNFTRGRIYEHIRINPGEHYRAIKKTLELNNGNLTYHLMVLEKEDYIKSRTDGFCKRFYPVGMKITKGQPKSIQELILKKISESPFVSQKELAEEFGINVSTVNYHINIMTGAGIIGSEKEGRVKHYFIEGDQEIILGEDVPSRGS